MHEKKKLIKLLDLKKQLLEMRNAPDNSHYPLTRRQVEKMLSQYERREDENGWNDSPEYRSVDGWKKARWYAPEVDSDFLPDNPMNVNKNQRPAKLMPYDYFFNVYKLGDENPLDHDDIDNDDDKENYIKDLNWKGETNIFESILDSVLLSESFDMDDYTDEKMHDKYIQLKAMLTPTNLDKKSVDAIHAYTYFSKDINRSLYDADNGGMPNPRYLQHADDINAALDEFPTPSKDFVVYHGVSDLFSTEDLERGDFINAGFMSSSLSPRVAVKFAQKDVGGNAVLFRIHINKGTNVGGFVEKYSGSREEKEYLIKHHTHFKVMSEAETFDYNGKHVKVYDLVIV